MLNSDSLENGLGIPSLSHFVYDFSKMFHVIFNLLAKLQCLIVFTSCDIGQYVPCNCLFSSL